ncbi:MAG: hypothetical protein ACM3ZF_00675, partial [Mycobacterium leprae]
CPVHSFLGLSTVTELPGDGSFAPERVFHPAAGVLPARFCAGFLQALPPRVRDQRWHTRRHDVLSVAGVVLAPPTLAGGDRGPTRTAAAVGGVAGTFPTDDGLVHRGLSGVGVERRRPGRHRGAAVRRLVRRLRPRGPGGAADDVGSGSLPGQPAPSPAADDS